MNKHILAIAFLATVLLASCAKDLVEFNPDIHYGGFTDTRNGEVYNTVEIGDQTWMAENLRSFSNDPNEVNCCNYGKLFTLNAKYCPEGWHLPDSTEWQSLINFLGGNYSAGGKLKETGDTHWESPNAGATNSSGFTALGAGSADYYDGLKNRKKTAEFWTSTLCKDDCYSAYSFYYITLYYNNEEAKMEINTGELEDEIRKSIRCIKNY